jgi:hypothetical protein
MAPLVIHCHHESNIPHLLFHEICFNAAAIKISSSLVMLLRHRAHLHNCNHLLLRQHVLIAV